MAGMQEYNIETGTWRQVVHNTRDVYTATMHMMPAPSMENPHQVLLVDINSAKFCDFSKENTTCSPMIAISSIYQNVWAKERNEFFYYSFEDSSVYSVSATTYKATRLTRKFKEPRKVASKSDFIYANFQYNALDDALYFTSMEIGPRNDVFQVVMSRMNVSSGVDEIVYQLCSEVSGNCHGFGSLAMHVMNDGTVVTVKGNEEKNKLVRFTPSNLPTPKPRPVDPNLTWLIVMGGIIASVVVLGVLVTVGIVAISAYIKNRTYVSV
jgi:hypothetical protein